MIYFVSYESELYFELWIILKNLKVGFFSKTRHCFKFRICSKMENLENGKPAVPGVAREISKISKLPSLCDPGVPHGFPLQISADLV